MKPLIHAQNSVKKHKGKVDDYLKYHCWLDHTKAHFPSHQHRILHSSWGIYLGEELFGVSFLNSDGIEISTRTILEEHCLEDLGCIPTLADYLMNMTWQPWMSGSAKGLPPSLAGVAQKSEEKSPEPKDIVYDWKIGEIERDKAKEWNNEKQLPIQSPLFIPQINPNPFFDKMRILD